MNLNLANQPFVNSRPVRRLVLVLWCLSVLLIAANLFFYTKQLAGRQARSDRVAALTELESRERERLAQLESELAGADLEWQNRQVEFLNLRIAERVFPWSRLFDRLTEAMPRPVRLTRLRPVIENLSRSAAGSEETVSLEIRAEARNEEAILDFITQLFEHPAFRNPNLSSETRRGRSETTEFSLSAIYLPARAAATPAAAEPPSPAGEAPPRAVQVEAAEAEEDEQ